MGIALPTVDVRSIMTDISQCVCARIGPVRDDLVSELRDLDLDFAPVLGESEPRAHVLGLVSRSRLAELATAAQPLEQPEVPADRAQLGATVGLDILLERMAESPAWLVVAADDAITHGPAVPVQGLVCRADLNKHPVRVAVYGLLAELELMAARLVQETFRDPADWFGRLSEDSQARILGYWELAKRLGVDTGPVAGATLSELLRAIGGSQELLRGLGYPSRTRFEDASGRIPDVRNRVMHPVRPLITNVESCTRLREILLAAAALSARMREFCATRDPVWRGSAELG